MVSMLVVGYQRMNYEIPVVHHATMVAWTGGNGYNKSILE